ncbi:HD-GYP domain-containing protein [Sphingomonas edaphi]|uniref:HD domain-containing protein n=1 Tax=Sphingomonas edaphi TaxID=2315689 RepID=A0A418PYQ4_9SPHN|nr:HD domain-containing phosphohydrolase [Sphingomonas edaphi]RIX27128.1 HD domain-containing protein [Sphingomonas edaphi]
MLHQSIAAGEVAYTSLAELLGSFSYALDITEGQPAGHSLRSALIGSRIGRAIGLSASERHSLYYTILLKDLGCSSNAARICELYQADDRAFKHGYKTVGTSLAATLVFIFSRTAARAPWRERASAIGHILRNGDDIAQDLIVTRCTRGADIARTLRFDESVCEGIFHLDEHWDGSGRPSHLRGDAIPLFSRIALLAQIADVFHEHAGAQAAMDELRRRAGVWLDPELVDVACRLGAEESFWSELQAPGLEARAAVFAPPTEAVLVDDDYLDDIARAFGEVIDAKSPFTAGHSSRVADLSSSLSLSLGLDQGASRSVRRAAYLHDVGKLGVSNNILDKPAGLTDPEWQEMRAHADHTREILGRIGPLAALADTAAAHHERLDGRGYPLGLSGSNVSLETRIITTCDFFDAITADRPYRSAMGLDAALGVMKQEVGTALDPLCFDALEAIAKQG